MSDIAIVFAVVAGTIVLFVWNRLPLIVVAMGSALSLYLTGILSLDQSLQGFGDPVVMFIASLFVVTAGLEATGVTAWMGQRFRQAAAGSATRLQWLAMVTCAALCPLINASGAVAALLPVVMLMVVRLEEEPGRYLMPMAFAAGAGSHLALTGAPKNVLIADAAADSGAGSIAFFEFALVGLPLLVGTVAIVVLFGDRLVPRRGAANLPPDFSRHAQTLVEQYRLASDVYTLRVRARSQVVGLRAGGIDRAAHPMVRLVTVTDPSGAPRLGTPLTAGDLIVVRGPAPEVAAFAEAFGLKLTEASGEGAAERLINRMAGVVEVVIAPRSPLIGRQAFAGMVTSDGDLLVVAIQRRGEDLAGEVAIEAGDTLLVQGAWETLDRRGGTRGVLLVDRPDMVKRQLVPLGVGAKSMLGILAAMVAAIALGLTPPAVAALVAAGATVVLGHVSVESAYRAVNWTTVILIAAMFPLSTGLYETGAAQRVAEAMVAVTGEASPRVLLAALFIVAAVLGVVISNTATTMIFIPVAVLAAETLAVSALPVLMALSVATSAAFLTPVSTPVNTMVMGPAGYRFGDYWRLGLPLTLLYFAVAVWLVPLIWPF
jgi:di/tricarboxylate transporter